MKLTLDCRVLIIGGGLSGLKLASELQAKKFDWMLLEARSTLGGRLANDNDGDDIDLGGAWFWPPHQPHMMKLVQELNVSTFPQPDDPSSTRIRGGAVELVSRMAQNLPSERIVLNSPVVSLTRETDEHNNSVVHIETASGNCFAARQVVLCAPPKLVAKHIQFGPKLSEPKRRAMEQSQTWMAGVTKIALVYSQKFWDAHSSNMGLPGRPAFQVYDASTNDVAALTFFTVATGIEKGEELAQRVASQMSQVWSMQRREDLAEKVLSYVKYHVQRWPLEQHISEETNPRRVNPHPSPVPVLAASEWDGLLLFAGTETDQESPGVMEGAIGSSLRVIKELERVLE